MNTCKIQLNLDPLQAEDVRIVINGKEYSLSPTAPADTTSQEPPPPTLVTFVGQLNETLIQYGRKRTAETYRSALNSFLHFLAKPDIDFGHITPPLIIDYEYYLKQQGIASNSSSFYMRVLRTIYNRAVTCGYTIDSHPFANVYTGISKTDKRAISIQSIHDIFELTDLSGHELFARDLFLFSFYTRGMSFIDIAYLRPTDIRNGVLTYRRHKTGQTISMRWETQMQEIVDRHPSANRDYLLPIIKRSNGCERSQYRECQRKVNYMLKVIGQKAGVAAPLTMYVARHTWASIAMTMGVSLNIISEGMGHTSESTTRIYLKSLDTSRIDNANAEIIKLVHTHSG